MPDLGTRMKGQKTMESEFNSTSDHSSGGEDTLSSSGPAKIATRITSRVAIAKLELDSLLIAFLSLLFLCAGCFPNTEVATRHKEMFSRSDSLASPTKVFLADGSVALFPHGLRVRNDTIIGVSQRYWISEADTLYRRRMIPFDSIAAMTSYESNTSFGRGLASFLFGWWGPSMTFTAIRCLICPKCCFGSCPTVYSSNGSQDVLRAELFSSSISKQLEGNDLDFISDDSVTSGPYQLRVTNEALETHYINRFTLLAVDHPKGSRILPTGDGTLIAVGPVSLPHMVVNRAGKDVSRMVSAPDASAYRSGSEAAMKLTGDLRTDWLDVTIDVPQGATNLTMVLRLRNTLLTTILLYDVVLGSQGIGAMAWTERMNTDARYASQFGMVYDLFSGISLKTHRNGAWTQQSSIKDVGPIAWKTVAAEIPVHGAGRQTVRLEFFPDNYLIDYIAIDTGRSFGRQCTLQSVPLLSVRDNAGEMRSDVLPLIAGGDDRYLVTNPGESYRLQYELPPLNNDRRTLFVASRGYYNEWIRGSWLTPVKDGYQFDLFEIDRTLDQLAESWEENKDLIEQRFNETRIPVQEVP